MNVQTIELDLAKRTGRQQQVTIAQGDAAGTTIVATIYDNGTKLAETGVTAKFLIGLPDNRHYMRDDATYEDGVITYVCDESRIASVHGYTDNAYFELHKGDTVASTERFSVIIEQCAYDGMDEGETYDTEIEQALRAMATAIGAVSDAVEMAEGAVSDATTAVTEAQQAVTTANAVTQQAQAAVADAEAATTAANEAAETATEAAETITEANLPNVSVGAANGITGDSGDTAAWLQSVSTADGPTTVRSIHGRTAKWNQLCRILARTATSKGVTYTASASGKVSLVGTATGDETFQLNTIPEQAPTLVSGHKYVLLGGSDSIGAYINTLGVHAPAMFTASMSGAQQMVCNVKSTFSQSTAYEFYPQLFDVTAMFGAGSEPSTIEEFKALYPADYYPYDAGSLLPVNMTGIATEDADGNPLQTRTIPAGTLRKAGTAYDELTAKERTTRIAEIDMGSLTWVASQATSNAFYANVKNIMDYKFASDVQAECVPYAFQGTTIGTSQVLNGRMALYYNAGAPGTRELYVRDLAYSDAAAFKAAMDGVILYYEVATPTVTTYDPPLNLTYRTEQGGTERVMVPTGENSAPPTIVAAHGYTAESLRDAALATIAPVENGLASTNYAIGTYLIHDGSLCKVTRAIAAGESIEIGTNVTTTTVMAELLALTQ